MKFTVKKSEWNRAHLFGLSFLLNNSGKKCCLGFVGQQCGINDLLLVDYSYPIAANKAWPEWFWNVIDYNSDAKHAYLHLAEINDSISSDEEKELKIKEIFAKFNDEIVFKD